MVDISSTLMLAVIEIWACEVAGEPSSLFMLFRVAARKNRGRDMHYLVLAVTAAASVIIVPILTFTRLQQIDYNTFPVRIPLRVQQRGHLKSLRSR